MREEFVISRQELQINWCHNGLIITGYARIGSFMGVIKLKS